MPIPSARGTAVSRLLGTALALVLLSGCAAARSGGRGPQLYWSDEPRRIFADLGCSTEEVPEGWPPSPEGRDREAVPQVGWDACRLLRLQGPPGEYGYRETARERSMVWIYRSRVSQRDVQLEPVGPGDGGQSVWIVTGIDENKLPASPADVQLDQLQLLAGCWKGSFGGGSGTIEEFYTSPSDNLILGTTRYLRDGKAIQYEFTRIETKGSNILLTPYPGGTLSDAVFVLTGLTSTEAIFEAPEHDFPKRIIYRVNDDGSRTARIDGGTDDSEAQVWRLKRASCD